MQFLMPILSFLIAVAATFAVRAAAVKLDVVCHPRADRWSTRSVALLGGIAIFVGLVASWLILGIWDTSVLFVLLGTSLLFFTGLIDDFTTLKPYQKLIFQLVAAAILPASGLTLPWSSMEALNIAITVFWLIGITNAVNLLDNMDGLAAGIGAIACLFLAYMFFTADQHVESTLMLCFAGVLLGFLIYNWNPASIFMGDCGSMTIGYFMAGMSLLYASSGRSRSFLPVIAVPVLILLIPIFDTSIVSLLRKLAGRKISIGGRDHTSHRLVALGLSEKRAVLLLYAMSISSGLLGVVVSQLPLFESLTALLAFVIGLTLLGVYFGRVEVYDEHEVRAARDQPIIGFFVNVSQKQPVFEVLLDVALIVLAFQLALLFHDDGLIQGRRWGSYLNFMLILIEIKLPIFLAMGLYREIWRFVSIHSAIVVFRAVGVSALVAAGLVRVSTFTSGITVSLVAIESALLFVLILGSRLTFRALRQIVIDMRLPHETRRRAVIFGAGDGGDLLCRELRNNRTSTFVPVAFIDDDGLKVGRRIHGLTVLPGNDATLESIRSCAATDMIISSSSLDAMRLNAIEDIATEAGVKLWKLSICVRPAMEDTSSRQLFSAMSTSNAQEGFERG